jgi:hypothetical protein
VAKSEQERRAVRTSGVGGSCSLHSGLAGAAADVGAACSGTDW